MHGVPSPEHPPLPSYPDKNFTFDRLGIRVPTILVSPWIAAGTVISAPPDAQKPTNTSEYDLTSIIATARKLLMDPEDIQPLTRRDAWAGTFEHALSLDAPRAGGGPRHLPDAPPPTRPPGHPGYEEAAAPLNDLQVHIGTLHAHLAGVAGVRFANATSFPPADVTMQGHLGPWLQRHFAAHREHTEGQRALLSRRWAANNNKKKYSVALRAKAAANWTDTAWTVSDLGNEPPNLPYSTISPRNKTKNGTTTFNGAHYCLERAGPAKSGTSVGVAPCDTAGGVAAVAQRWVLRNDATLRPYPALTLCVTNHLESDDDGVVLAPCDNSVSQHWAYHGPNLANNSNSGQLYFGDDTNALGVVV